MSSVYRFIYDSEYDENGSSSFPQATTINARHYFEEGSTWVPILWQFCKFLESTGYVGVTQKVVLKGMCVEGLFETIDDVEEDNNWDEVFKQTQNFDLDSYDKDAC